MRFKRKVILVVYLTDILLQSTLYVVGTPLTNKAHEAFVNTYLGHPKKKFNATFAYKTAYPEASKATAAVEACRVMKYPDIKNRLLEVMQESGITDERITEKLSQLLENPKGTVQLGALRTILEVRKDIDGEKNIGLQVNIGDLPKHDQKISILGKYAQRNAD